MTAIRDASARRALVGLAAVLAATVSTLSRAWSARRAVVGLAACLLAVLPAACGEPPAAVTESRSGGGGLSRAPNIIWMVADALAPPFGSSVAALASDGVSYEVAARPVFAATLRSELLTGVDAGTLGLVDEGLAAPPASGVSVLPERLRRAGYYTSRAGQSLHNLSVAAPGADGDPLAQPGLLGAWDAAGPEADWRGRRKDWEYPCTVAFGCGGPPHDPERPFFALFNLTTSGAALDAEVGRVLAALAEDDLERTTAVFLTGSAPGAPLVVRWPAGAAADATEAGPVRVVDLAPTALALAEVPVPQYMTGRSLLRAGAGAGAGGAGLGPAGQRHIAEHGDAAQQGARERTGGVVAHAAAATAPGSDAAAVSLGAAARPRASTPAGYPTGGLFHVAPRVELWCDTDGATIVYTTEREAPFYWRLYTGPFRMRFWTLRAQCGRLGYRDSEVLRYEFDIE
ncbi:MAG: hypothetical protein OXH75_21300 [Acidobacteria bacterium]|nr:hypothetical protein [Acidobacteriota bacterium]